MTGPDNRNADAAAGLTMTFTPALVDGSYSPNQAYSVTFDGANGLTMVGSSAGAWSNPPGSTAACTANGQTGFYHQDNAAQVADFVATWTAPGNGSVTIGGSRAAGYGPTNTQQMTLNPPGQTSRPTPAPTQAPVPASTGTFDPNLCTDTALWSVYDTAAFPDVKMCFRKIGSTDFEFAMQSPAGFYAALGISSSETGMNDLDVYSFLASSKTVQTRYADAKSKPAIEDTAGYADILTLASQSGLEQVVFRRPQAASGNRKDLTGTADYVLLGAYGETSGSPEDMNQHIRKSASSGAVSMAEAGLIGANVAKFSSGSKMAHGAMMVFAWVFLCPTAIFDARAAKGVLGPLWFQLHRAMQTLAVLLTIIGIIIISTDDTVKITAESPEASQTHSNIGYTVLAFSIFQVLLGYTRNLISQHDAKHKDPDHPHGPRRWLFNYAHYATGLVLVILSLLNVFSGYGTFRLNSHRFDRFELDFRGHTQP